MQTDNKQTQVLPIEVMLQGKKLVDTKTGRVLATQLDNDEISDYIEKAINNFPKVIESNRELLAALERAFIWRQTKMGWEAKQQIETAINNAKNIQL